MGKDFKGLWLETLFILQQGQCLLTKGDFQAATNLIDKAHQICPDFGLAGKERVVFLN
jgi:hypothetical protein